MAKYNIVFLFVLAISVLYAEALTFDITKYGAKPNGGDASQALISAWKAACATPGGGTILVPKGIFLMKNVMVEGPCKGRMVVNLQGTIKAPTDANQLKKGTDWISFYHVDGFTLYGGGVIDGQGQQTWAKKLAKQVSFMQPTNLGLNFLTNAIVSDISIQNSKMFQTNVLGCKNITLQRVTVTAPYDSPNTDGIHIGRSNNVKVLDCPIATGDDCVSIGDGAQQVTVTNVKCGPGHGIAIGSLGKYSNEEHVVGIFVKNCSLTNTENGLRVKTWENSVGAGIASDVHFEDIILTNVTYPINVDQEYCPSGTCPASDAPSKVKISKLSFKGITGTSATKEIVKLVCSKTVPCSEVEIGHIDIKYSGPEKPVPSTRCANVHPKLTSTQNPPIKF